MARFKVVHGPSWDNDVCSVLYETDVQEMALSAATRASDATGDTYIPLDSADPDIHFPRGERPLLRTEAQLTTWIGMQKLIELGNGVSLQFKLRNHPESIEQTTGKFRRDGRHGVILYDQTGKRVAFESPIEQWKLLGPDGAVIDGDVVV